MKTVCNLDMCAGCMACIDICPVDAIKIIDRLSSYNAEIDQSKCINCNACHDVCPTNHRPVSLEAIQWKQGWAEEKIRGKSSSGGFATAIMNSFIQNGGIVCACTFSHGKFEFKFVDDIDKVRIFAGSKYVKSNPSGIYREILNNVKKGTKVLFIGLPCQVAGVKNYIGAFDEYLYTIDLICHGTPSPKLLNMSLEEYGYNLSEVQDIQFRNKGNFGISLDGTKILPQGVRDRYIMAFLAGLSYTENCYNCDYADRHRISDLTIGDSWGTDLIEEEKSGISIGISLTEKGIELLEQSNLELFDVDIESAIAANYQLQHPTTPPESKELFFSLVEKNRGFNYAVKMCFPKVCFRQDVKSVLTTLGIMKILKKIRK